MKMQPHIARRIFWNIVVSLFIYALPVVLMFLSLYVTGKRPWQERQRQGETMQQLKDKDDKQIKPNP